jgi:hypothetical protein
MYARCLQITRFPRNHCTRHELRRRYVSQGEDLESLMYPQLDAQDVEVRMQAHCASPCSNTNRPSPQKRRVQTTNTCHAHDLSAEGGTPTAPTPVKFRGRPAELRHHRRTTSSTFPDRQSSFKTIETLRHCGATGPIAIGARKMKPCDVRRDGAIPTTSACCLPHTRRVRSGLGGLEGHVRHVGAVAKRSIY